MKICHLFGNAFVIGGSLYDRLKSLNPERGFLPICDMCFVNTWEKFDRDEFEGEELVYTDTELVYDKIFHSRGFKTVRW